MQLFFFFFFFEISNQIKKTTGNDIDEKILEQIEAVLERNKKQKEEEEAKKKKVIEAASVKITPTMTVQQVGKWLESRGFGDLVKIFADNEIDGSVAMKLTDSELKEMGVKALGKRSKFLDTISLEKSPSASASPAPSTTMKTTMAMKLKAPVPGASRFGMPANESTEYKGKVATLKPPTQPVKEELMANKDAISKVPMLSEIVEDCEKILEKTVLKRVIASQMIKTQGLTRDEVLAMVIYSYDVRPLGGAEEENLYLQFNNALRERGKDFTAWYGFLYYLKSALKKLPEFKGTVFRGSNNPKTAAPYSQSTLVTWSAFSSASFDRQVALNFAGSTGTIFNIKIVSGKDISPFSAIQGEAEILLPPNAELFVTESVHPSHIDGVAEITLMEQAGSFKW